jgi:ribonuclease Z
MTRRAPVASPGSNEKTAVAKAEEIEVCGLKLRGVARGGVETCLRVPELGLMFDVGLCPAGALRFDTILVSHGHADHLAGLPYLISSRAMIGAPPPTVHIPREIEAPLRRILESWSEIEGFEPGYVLCPHAPGDRFEVGEDLSVTALRTVHRVPSLGYVVERRTHRLKAEYRGRDGRELAELRAAGEAITEPISTPLLCVSGDTQIEFLLDNELVRKTRVLVYEVTSWDDRRDVAWTRDWGHTHVDEMIEHAEKFEGEALVLVHRSLRHSREDARRVVRERFPASVRDKIHVFGH